MNLRYITCSDPREDVDINDLIALAISSPVAEIAVQAHPSKMSHGMARNTWFNNVIRAARNCDTAPNLAVHVNMDWANLFSIGIIPDELKDWICATRIDGQPVIKRWQINIHGSKTPLFKTSNVAQLIKTFPNHEFIFQYGADEYNRMQRLYKTGLKFSVLYDTSNGCGISPKRLSAPLFPDIPNGYSGGISPENVMERLDKINAVAKNRNDIWIDAEGKLKTPGTKVFDLARARQYIQNATMWQQSKSK